jgi:uncharacterized SAM-binding protein YcdF (DUF218 family)
MKRLAWWTLAAVLVAGLLFHGAILSSLGNYLVHDEPPQHADVIFVLAGDATGRRVLKGAELVREGYAPAAMVSGPPYYLVHECDLAIALAEQAGYPASYFIPFPHDAHSTTEEARDVAPKFRQMGVHHVLLVTSNFHTRRAAKAFRASAPDISFDVVGAEDAYFNPQSWWRNREGQKTFFIEWAKTIATWFGI